MSSFDYRQRGSQENFQHNGYPPLNPHFEDILIVVKTAPHPSVSYTEVVCTAGITKNKKWIRLYPINFRYLPPAKWYKKYQWVRVKIWKNKKDFRIDSYRPDVASIKLIGEPLPAGKWRERKKIVLPTASNSLEELKKLYQERRVSLGIFKPQKVEDLIIEESKIEWSKKHQSVLSQLVLFGQQPKDLEKIPYKFSYYFKCEGNNCRRHKLQIVDWEIYELYRNLKNRHGYSIDIILEKIKQCWLYKMWDRKRDSYLIVGTRHPMPTFIVLGVFWPPREK